VPDPTSSGGFNRYRYTRNNPLKYQDPTGHAECVDADCKQLVHPITGKIIGDDKRHASILHQVEQSLQFGLDFYSEVYDKVVNAVQTLPEDIAERTGESLQDTAETVQSALSPGEREMGKTYDTILGRDDVAVVLNMDFQAAVPLVRSLGYKTGIQMIIHPSGDSLRFTRTETNQMYAGGIGITYSGAILFNANDFDEAAMVDQAVSVSGAFGGGATASLLSASSVPTPRGDTPWGIAIGPSVGLKFALGHETTTSNEIYRWNAR
jgi:hypothetical protein